MLPKPDLPAFASGSWFTVKRKLSEKAAWEREQTFKHDGRTRRYLMKRIIKGLIEPFNGGGSSELKPR